MGETTLPDWHRRDNFHTEPHQAVVNQLNRVLNLSVSDRSDVYDLGNGRGIVPHGTAQVRIMRAFKITGDVPTLGGTYKILIGSPGSNTLNPSPTSATTLSLTNSIDFTNTNNTGFLINTKETGLQIRLLSTSDGVVRWGPLMFSATSAANAPVIVADLPLPQTLSCANTASGTNPPVYTPFREGTSTNQPLAKLQVPIRLFAPNGTNFTITAANICGYRLSGTGIVMTWAGETNQANLCS